MEYLIKKVEVLTFFDTAAMEAVAVTRGRVWLTNGCDSRDHCLDAGARLPVGNSCRVVIEALDDAALSVVWRGAPVALRIALAPLRQALSGPSGSSG